MTTTTTTTTTTTRAAYAAECAAEEATPTVQTWHTPPECQGQIVERAYGTDDSSDPWRRITDRSDGSVRYVALDRESLDASEWADWIPWHREPTAEESAR